MARERTGTRSTVKAASAWLAIVAGGILGASCSVVEYAEDRALDATDLIDFQHPTFENEWYADNMGIGVRTSLTHFFNPTFGGGGYLLRETFGRFPIRAH